MLALMMVLLAPMEPAKQTEAFKPLGSLIGSWKGTGKPDAKPKEFWSEKQAWVWAFDKKKGEAWLELTVEKSAYIATAKLTHDAKTEKFTLTTTAPDKTEKSYTGTLSTGKQKETLLVLERTDGDTVEEFRITLLHENRYLYQLSSKPKDGDEFTRLWQVGCTKEGVAFATSTENECIVSGGKGTMKVSHNGKTYYVCCSGCKAEFESDPEKFIKLAAEKKK
jgi:YHS domain-containing protein